MKYTNLLFMLLLVSCGENSAERQSRLQDEKKQLQKEQRASAKAQLINYYNPVVGWDSAKVFTYWYQENLCDGHKKVYFEGRIRDIIKVDSTNYTVKIDIEKNYNNESDNRSFLIECAITQEQKMGIEKNMITTNGHFIITVSNAKRFFPTLKLEKDYDGDVFLDYDFDEKLILLKGSLIDFRLFEN